jgi:K+-sensing histidine kinase KdpD
MVIEYNKDLHIELLRDEIILTREELEKKHKVHRTYCEIVNEVHSTIRLDELKEIARETIETILKLEKYALIVWDSKAKQFIIMESRNMAEQNEAEALKKLESVKNVKNMESSADMVYLPLNEGKTILGALCLPGKDYRSATKENWEVLRLAVGQMTRALENSVLYEDARKNAVTDDKTDLFNQEPFRCRA